MASWDRAQLWHIPMPYEWANVSSFTMQYWWLMERLSPSNISGLTHWYARSEWTAAKGPYAAGIEADCSRAAAIAMQPEVNATGLLQC